MKSDFNELFDILETLDTVEAKIALLEARKQEVNELREVCSRVLSFLAYTKILQYEMICIEWLDRFTQRRSDELNSFRVHRLNAYVAYVPLTSSLTASLVLWSD